MERTFSKFSIEELKNMKIFDYNPNLGTFSLGFESFSQNEVVEVVNLSKNAEFAYNKSHKQWFLSSNSQISTYEPENSFDLAIFNPDIGENIGRRGKSNFKIEDLKDCLQFLGREMPKFAIFTLNIDAIPLLNTSEEYVRDGFGQLSKDFLIAELQKLGYKAYLVALDEASYGIPTHRDVALYIATPNGFDMSFPHGLFTRYGRGEYNRFRTIADAIGDLGALGEWVPYLGAPQNTYQRHLRRGLDRITWNFMLKKLTEPQKKAISKIRQGSSASKTEGIRQKSGYVRPRWNRICPPLNEKFYMVSSKAPCIHPIANRPFTMREGMRISGLPDTISFDLKTSRPEMAKMITTAIAPAIGEVSAIALRSIG